MRPAERPERAAGRRRCLLAAATLVAAAALPMLVPAPVRAAGFLSRVLRILGLTAAPGQLRDDVQIVTGRLWIADLKTGKKRPLTSDAGWTSPLFQPKGSAVVALKAGKIVRVPLEGGAGAARELVRAAAGVVKLVAFDPSQPREILVLTGGAAPLGMLSLATGKVEALSLPEGTEEKNLVAYASHEDRRTGTIEILVETETRQEMEESSARQVVVVRDTKTGHRDVVRSEEASCRQPDLSSDRRFLVYVEVE